jgi:hypothetical protein
MPRYYDRREWRGRVRRQALFEAGHCCQHCGCSLLNMGKQAHVHHKKSAQGCS